MGIGYWWCGECKEKVGADHEHTKHYIPPEIQELEERIRELESWLASQADAIKAQNERVRGLEAALQEIYDESGLNSPTTCNRIAEIVKNALRASRGGV